MHDWEISNLTFDVMSGSDRFTKPQQGVKCLRQLPIPICCLVLDTKWKI